MGMNIEEVSGTFTGTTMEGADGWVFDADLTDAGLVVVSGDFDWVSPESGDVEPYAFSALSTDAYGTLEANADDGTFTFTIDREAAMASGGDQSVSFTVASGSDTDIVTINLLICVARGTRVQCAGGARSVEEIKAGDLVWTRDSGLQRVRWVGSRKLNGAELRARPDLRPVVIRPGALGKGRPARALTVSPQHKVLVTGWRAQMFFGEDEVLVPAKALVDDRKVMVDHACREVEYFHLLFDRHQIIRTEGAETESFRPGATTLNEVDLQTRDELLALFPQLGRDAEAFGAPARPVIRVQDARVLTRSNIHVA
jgi:hypothetical protein